MIPSFAGFRVRGVEVDWPLRLWAGIDGEKSDWLITIQGPMTLTGRDNAKHPQSPLVIDLEKPDAEGQRALKALVGHLVKELIVTEDSGLILDLETETLTSEADPDFESWEVVGNHGEALQCFPGGELGYSPSRSRRNLSTGPA